MKSLLLEQAILSTQQASLIPQLDVLAHYANLNNCVSCFQDASGELMHLDKDLGTLTKEDAIYFREDVSFSTADGYHSVNAGKVIFSINFSGDNYKHIRQCLGAHNNNKKIDHYFSDKNGALLLPYELISVAKESSIPKNIGIEKAYNDNPLHPCFFHKIIPAPVAGVAVNSSLDSMIGFVVHPKLLLSALDANTSEVDKLSLSIQYDTKLALSMLNLKYGITVNKQVVEALEKLDEELIKNKDKTTYLDIEGQW